MSTIKAAPEGIEFNWPMPQQPGPETEALRRFHRDVTWTGTIKANGLVPEMTAKGRGIFRWIDGGLWVMGEFHQDQFYLGRRVTEWSAQYIAGWDYSRRSYVALRRTATAGACLSQARLTAIVSR
jgi:hypothetical protein